MSPFEYEGKTDWFEMGSERDELHDGDGISLVGQPGVTPVNLVSLMVDVVLFHFESPFLDYLERFAICS